VKIKKKQKILDRSVLVGFILLLFGGVIWTIANYVKYYNPDNINLWVGLGVASVIIWLGVFISLFVEIKLLGGKK